MPRPTPRGSVSPGEPLKALVLHVPRTRALMVHRAAAAADVPISELLRRSLNWDELQRIATEPSARMREL
jgi:hypothetical protein